MFVSLRIFLRIYFEICLEISHVEENHFKKFTVSQNLRQAHLLEVGLTRIPSDHETLCIVLHVGLLVDFSSMKSSMGLQAFTFVCEVNLDDSTLMTNENSYIAMVMGLQSCV